MTDIPEIPSPFTIVGVERLDKELSEHLRISREAAKRLIVSGRVKIGASTKHHPAKKFGKPTDIEILPEPPRHEETPPLSGVCPNILYEDDVLLAVDKPSGMPVHPGAGHASGTLVDILAASGVPLAGSAEPKRVGLVHRLDKDTSGVILIAKKSGVLEDLMRQFAARTVEKEYLAVIQGRLSRSPIRIEGSIGRHPGDRKRFGIRTEGREAQTLVNPIVVSATHNATFVSVTPKTGRTHQIRVHLKYAGFPIVGDVMYGVRGLATVRRMLLHARRLSFTHPLTGQRIVVASPIPADFMESAAVLGFEPQDLRKG